MELTRHERIMLRKANGSRSRHSRKLTRYSDSYNELFNFFLNSYRKGLLNFAGVDVDVDVIFNSEGGTAKEIMRWYETGAFSDKPIVSRQNNILRGVIIGKKSFGLHVKMWSEGIADGDFAIREILDVFNDRGIKMPDSLLAGFENEVLKRKTTKNEAYLNRNNCI